jgi:hypothetical protein
MGKFSTPSTASTKKGSNDSDRRCRAQGNVQNNDEQTKNKQHRQGCDPQ